MPSPPPPGCGDCGPFVLGFLFEVLIGLLWLVRFFSVAFGFRFFDSCRRLSRSAVITSGGGFTMVSGGGPGCPWGCFSPSVGFLVVVLTVFGLVDAVEDTLGDLSVPWLAGLGDRLSVL